jgi:hypothetical protein
MNAHAVDSPLNVLKTESMLTLQQLQQAVESYLEDPADTNTLKAAISSANQMHGVFVMLDEPDASALVQEVKLLAQDLSQARLSVSDTLY